MSRAKSPKVTLLALPVAGMAHLDTIARKAEVQVSNRVLLTGGDLMDIFIHQQLTPARLTLVIINQLPVALHEGKPSYSDSYHHGIMKRQPGRLTVTKKRGGSVGVDFKDKGVIPGTSDRNGIPHCHVGIYEFWGTDIVGRDAEIHGVLSFTDPTQWLPADIGICWRVTRSHVVNEMPSAFAVSLNLAAYKSNDAFAKKYAPAKTKRRGSSNKTRFVHNRNGPVRVTASMRHNRLFDIERNGAKTIVALFEPT